MVPALALAQFRNSQPRVPCVLILDTSGTMEGERLTALNEGLEILWQDLLDDPIARERIEIAVVEFSSDVRITRRFDLPSEVIPQVAKADGLTAMGKGIREGLRLVEERTELYRKVGVPHYKPWVFLITDGVPTDDIDGPAKLIAKAEADRSLAFFAVGVADAKMEKLAKLSSRGAMRLDGLRFRDLFRWLSTSLIGVSMSRIGERVPLPQLDWTAV
jgi:uncharacterized protein YegL